MAGTMLQTPMVPGTRQDSQTPSQAASQQMPSTHCSELHSLSVPQVLRSVRLSSQVPEGAQKLSPGHAPSVHIIAQEVPEAQ